MASSRDSLALEGLAPQCLRALCAGLALTAAGHLGAQPMTPSTDSQIIRQARLVASAGRVEVYAHDAQVDPTLAALAAAAVASMQRMLGPPWDSAVPGEPIRI